MYKLRFYTSRVVCLHQEESMFLSARELIQELQWMDEGLAAIATWLVDTEIYGQECAPVRNG
jgi:hypothetical protein